MHKTMLAGFICLLGIDSMALAATSARQAVSPRIASLSRPDASRVTAPTPADREAVARIVRTIQQRNADRAKLGRGFHKTAIASGTAELLPKADLDPKLAAVLRAGIFGKALGSGVKGAFRFSDGQPRKSKDQRKGDVRGASMVFDFDGSAQGITFTNQQAQVLASGVDFLRTFEIMGRPGIGNKIAIPVHLAREVGAAKSARAFAKLVVGAQPIPDLFRTQYWGYPMVVGNTADGRVVVARPTLIPNGPKIGTGVATRIGHGVANGWPFNPDRRYLTNRAQRRLAEGPMEFTLALQFYRDPLDTPLTDDGDKHWLGPEVAVATVRLPQQGPPSDALRETIEDQGSFGPQIVAGTVEEPAVGVGNFQGQREIAYSVSSGDRGANVAKLLELLRSEAPPSERL